MTAIDNTPAGKENKTSKKTPPAEDPYTNAMIPLIKLMNQQPNGDGTGAAKNMLALLSKAYDSSSLSKKVTKRQFFGALRHVMTQYR